MLTAAIHQAIQHALEQAVAGGQIPVVTPWPEWRVEQPKDPAHGDYASPLALALAKPCKMNPRQIATVLLPYLQQNEQFADVDIAGPGFLNFRLSWPCLYHGLNLILERDRQFGHLPKADDHHYLLEFVSANPTGPLHFGHGRWAVLGDCLARLMRLAGYRVDTEFYINDAGAQMDNLGRSLQACSYSILAQQGQTLTPPAHALWMAFENEKKATEKGNVQFYHGHYIAEMAQQLTVERGATLLQEPLHMFTQYAHKVLLNQQQQQLSRYGVNFDCWFSEQSLHDQDEVHKTLAFLKEKGHTYEADGALWFRSTTFGDDKDKVLIKSDGSRTYFANDIAYHWNKLKRGYDRLINIWGADHHGHIVRMRGVLQALGYPADTLEVILGQMVNLFQDGEKIRMSKRTGEMITFAEVLEEVGRDATRYLLMQRSQDTTLDFDLALAKQQNADNPVFYVQYAHARICSIFRTAQQLQLFTVTPERIDRADLTLLVAPEERALLFKLLRYPEEVAYAAKIREPHRLSAYAQEVAAQFHSFYKQCRVLNEGNESLTLARLALTRATRIVLRNLLEDIFGISAPESM